MTSLQGEQGLPGAAGKDGLSGPLVRDIEHKTTFPALFNLLLCYCYRV